MKFNTIGEFSMKASAAQIYLPVLDYPTLPLSVAERALWDLQSCVLQPPIPITGRPVLLLSDVTLCLPPNPQKWLNE